MPGRQEVIWIDCHPQAGRETHDLHPCLVLSPHEFNDRTSLVVGLPMTTAAYNADNPFAVAAGPAPGRPAGRTNCVLCHQSKFFDWRALGGRPHPMKRLPGGPFAEACGVLNQIVQLG